MTGGTGSNFRYGVSILSNIKNNAKILILRSIFLIEGIIRYPNSLPFCEHGCFQRFKEGIHNGSTKKNQSVYCNES